MKSDKTFYLFEFDPSSLSQIRWAILNEAERIKVDSTKEDLREKERGNYDDIIKSMISFADFIGNVCSECVRSFPAIEAYLLLLSSNKKEQAERVLESIWCSLTESQKEEILNTIEKSRK